MLQSYTQVKRLHMLHGYKHVTGLCTAYMVIHSACYRLTHRLHGYKPVTGLHTGYRVTHRLQSYKSVSQPHRRTTLTDTQSPKHTTLTMVYKGCTHIEWHINTLTHNSNQTYKCTNTGTHTYTNTPPPPPPNTHTR